MPTGTRVEKMYEALKRKGYSKGKSARISPSRTGQALATGKPSKSKVSQRRRKRLEKVKI